MLETGDIVFSKPKKSTIRRYLSVELPQGEKYGHISIYVGNGQIVEAQIGKGVTIKNFKDWSERNDYRVFRVTGATQKDKQEAARIAKGMVGKEYNMMQAVKAFLSNKKTVEQKEYINKAKEARGFKSLFCSTVIVGAYPKIMFDSGRDPVNILPIDIMRSPHVREVEI